MQKEHINLDDKSMEVPTWSAIARSLAASVAASSNTAVIVVEEEIAESNSTGGGGNASCSSAKETYRNGTQFY